MSDNFIAVILLIIVVFFLGWVYSMVHVTDGITYNTPEYCDNCGMMSGLRKPVKVCKFMANGEYGNAYAWVTEMWCPRCRGER